MSQNVATDSVTAACDEYEPKQILIKGNLNSTSNFVSCLKECHGDYVLKEYEDHKRRKMCSKGEKTNVLKTKFISRLSQETFNKLVSMFVVHSIVVPLRVLDDSHFTEIIDLFKIDLVVMSRLHLVRETQTIYEKYIFNNLF